MGAKKHTAPAMDAPYPKDRDSLLSHLFSWPPTRTIRIKVDAEYRDLRPKVASGRDLLGYWRGRRPMRGPTAEPEEQVRRFVRLWDIPAEVFETLTGEKVPKDA